MPKSTVSYPNASTLTLEKYLILYNYVNMNVNTSKKMDQNLLILNYLVE